MSSMSEFREHEQSLYDLRTRTKTFGDEEAALRLAWKVLDALGHAYQELGLAEEGHLLQEQPSFDGEIEDRTVGELRTWWEDVQATTDEFNKGLDRLRQIFEAAGLEVW